MFLAKIHFKNPSDSRIEKISNNSYFFSLFAGPLFFAFKRSWIHFFTHLILTITTLGIGWVFYAVFSKTVLTDEYLSKGWQWVDERGKAIPKTKISEITQFAEKRIFYSSFNPCIAGFDYRFGIHSIYKRCIRR